MLDGQPFVLTPNLSSGERSQSPLYLLVAKGGKRIDTIEDVEVLFAASSSTSRLVVVEERSEYF
jgi:hypothetical protein